MASDIHYINMEAEYITFHLYNNISDIGQRTLFIS